MNASRPIRLFIFISMLGSMALVIVWAGVIGWRQWPRWRAVREMGAAEPGRAVNLPTS